jgi:tRNA (uracil-5-)-methyltransferase TRM9
MKKSVIRQLNQLNKDFYQKVAEPFSNSRSYYWQGWNKLVPYVQELTKERERVRILDIGCGNGRLGLFLREQIPQEYIQYVGVDNSEELIAVAKEQYEPHRMEPTFVKIDLVESLLKDELVEKLSEYRAHFISVLGVLHHIPSFELRQKLISDLGSLVVRNGYLAFTSWNFMESEKLTKKIVTPDKVGVDSAELDPHDVILDWQRGQTAYRYCHYTDRAERELLIKNSGLESKSEFTADGKSGVLNTYVVLHKSTAI